MVSITQRDDSTHEKTEMITTEIDVTRLENAVYVIERDMLNTYIKYILIVWKINFIIFLTFLNFYIWEFRDKRFLCTFRVT